MIIQLNDKGSDDYWFLKSLTKEAKELGIGKLKKY